MDYRNWKRLMRISLVFFDGENYKSLTDSSQILAKIVPITKYFVFF